MTGVLLRPDLKTAGGEVCDIMYNDAFVGTLTLVYRESDRLTGSVQLEEQSISPADKQDVYTFLQTYVQNVVDALGIRECEVLVMYSGYDFMITTDHVAGEASFDRESEGIYLHDDELDYEWVQDESGMDDIDPDNQDEVGMIEDWNNQSGYELVNISERRNRVEYHLYDQDSELAAEAIIHLYGSEVVGDIYWLYDPFNEEMDQAAELIASDFNDDETDVFIFNMNYNGETIDTMELTHVDLLNTEQPVWSDARKPNRDDYTVTLARDDDDTLTYEIYQQSRGGLPIGTATIDISERQLTGFIDFREPGASDDRELIAELLMEELDKEKNYASFNLSMLYRNQLIDEILFEYDEPVH